MKKILLLFIFLAFSPFAKANIADDYGDFSLFFTIIKVRKNNKSRFGYFYTEFLFIKKGKF